MKQFGNLLGTNYKKVKNRHLLFFSEFVFDLVQASVGVQPRFWEIRAVEVNLHRLDAVENSGMLRLQLETFYIAIVQQKAEI